MVPRHGRCTNVFASPHDPPAYCQLHLPPTVAHSKKAAPPPPVPFITIGPMTSNHGRSDTVLRSKTPPKHTAMKTLIARSLILAATIFTIHAAQASTPAEVTARKAHRTVLEQRLDRALNKHIVFPLTIKEKTTADIRVSLVVDLEGRVKVLECQGDNQELIDYVVRKLERIDIGDNPDGIWKTTHLLIRFRPEKA